MSTVLCNPSQRKDLQAVPEVEALDTRIALIQALIPLGLQAVEEVVHHEVELLAGPRYARPDGAPHRVRWGRQRGSVYLGRTVPGTRTRNRQPAPGGARGSLPDRAGRQKRLLEQHAGLPRPHRPRVLWQGSPPRLQPHLLAGAQVTQPRGPAVLKVGELEPVVLEDPCGQVAAPVQELPLVAEHRLHGKLHQARLRRLEVQIKAP